MARRSLSVDHSRTPTEWYQAFREHNLTTDRNSFAFYRHRWYERTWDKGSWLPVSEGRVLFVFADQFASPTHQWSCGVYTYFGGKSEVTAQLQAFLHTEAL